MKQNSRIFYIIHCGMQRFANDVFSTAQVFATDFPAELIVQVFTRTLLSRTICAKFIHSLFQPIDSTSVRLSYKRPSELQVFASNGRQNCKFSHQTAVRTASFRIKRPSELFASTLVNRSKRLSVRKLRRFSSMSGCETKFANFLYHSLRYATFC